MMPDREIAEIKRLTSEWFATEDERLMDAAVQLGDAGWTWEAMRPILTRAFNAGWEERDRAGCDHE